MIRHLALALLIATSFVCAVDALAQNEKSLRRAADLEWEAVPGASRYELEVRSLVDRNAKPATFFSPRASWKGRLKPGKYSLRLRVFDERNVPSSWGEPSEFWVKIAPPARVLPEANAQIATQETDSYTQEFKWEPVQGAESYLLEILDENGQVLESKNTSSTDTSITLPVAQVYMWRVTGIMIENEPGEVDAENGKFTLIGAKLPTPDVQDPETDFVREIFWRGSDNAASYQYSLDRQDPVSGKWTAMEKKTGVTETMIPFKETLPGGRYRMRIQAVAPRRPSSPVAMREFDVRDGDRSIEAANLARLRDSLEKPSPYYFIASYLLTNIQYQGIVRERATEVSFDAIGGTGRLGLGYVFKQSPWSTFTIVDLSGFQIKGQTNTFASIESHAIWRRTWNVSLLRASGGLFYKELPEASGFGQAGASSSVEVSKVTSLGPHAGFEFIHPFTYKFGVQANARVYYGILGLSTPNGQSIIPDMSLQFSVLGSYRLTRDSVGFAGYSYRQDKASYKARPGDPLVPGSGVAREGDVNSIGVTGHYLNLIYEYSF